MRIITVNLPVSILQMIDTMIGEHGVYPSRSELIRVAVREFLIKELESSPKFDEFLVAHTKVPPKPVTPAIVDNSFVQVGGITYKLVHREREL